MTLTAPSTATAPPCPARGLVCRNCGASFGTREEAEAHITEAHPSRQPAEPQAEATEVQPA